MPRRKIDRIVGRDREIYRVIQILSRRTKKQPLPDRGTGRGQNRHCGRVGSAHCGGEVPPRLKDKEIHLLDLTALVAGTQFRGQFESRIKALVDEVKEEGISSSSSTRCTIWWAPATRRGACPPPTSSSPPCPLGRFRSSAPPPSTNTGRISRRTPLWNAVFSR